MSPTRFYVENKPKYKIYHELMRNRIKEVLLVSSRYDSFVLEEDGRLSDQIYEEFKNLNLRTLPRITRVSTTKEAVEKLQEEEFDLVITMQRLGEMDVFSFGQKVKNIEPDMPTVLLLSSLVEIKYLPDREKRKGIDRIFVWNGDSKIFVAIIKHFEDAMNVKRDTAKALVRVIIYVEDSIRHYSLILPELYSEIMKQTHRLISEGLNDFQDMLQLKARTKIILAETFDEAMEYYEEYKDFILGIITDVKIPKNGEMNETAGFDLVKEIKEEFPTMPINIQSSTLKHKKTAKKLDCVFIHKSSHKLLVEIRAWMLNHLGFGDFVFKLPSGKIIDRASDVIEFYEKLKDIPIESLYYHGSLDQFSRWLMARGEFEIAETLYNRKASEFEHEELRHYLMDIINKIFVKKTRGEINDFTRSSYHPKSLFIRLRPGSLGGKARGLAFLMTLLNYDFPHQNFPSVVVRIPKTIVIGTSEFEKFMENHDLWDFAIQEEDDRKIQRKFLEKKLSSTLVNDLKFLLNDLHRPLAIRSSSLLEDSAYHPFSGVFKTYMLPNNQEDITVRLQELCKAIKLVFASPFLQTAKVYAETIEQSVEASKMAVLIQEVVGKQYDDKFYPNFSGTASSYNYYPFASKMEPQDRVSNLALGLGRIIVEGGLNVRFCPKYPDLIRVMDGKKTIFTTQREFYGINLACDKEINEKSEEPYLKKYDLEIADMDGTLQKIADHYDYQDQMLKTGYEGEGTPVITFHKLLNNTHFKLPKLLETIMELGEKAMGCSVEIEYAGIFSDNPEEKHDFFLLQIRPFIEHIESIEETEITLDKDKMLLYSTSVSGNILLKDIKDLVYLKPDAFNKMKTMEMKKTIRNLNKKLLKKNVPYILLGIGRWGSTDKYLGVPVKWQDINGAKVIIEANTESMTVDFSQGSHFFQNIVTANIGYLYVEHESENNYLDWSWLEKQKVIEETEFVKHIKVDKPFTVKINARERKGTIIKPEKEEKKEK
ncbi:MAG: PEP/pyruvate-binding domain-containing protein [Asgard group archaeon]|nr:PEP/pyruvate-binding domain-containing protein [Asgard group archaeon]